MRSGTDHCTTTGIAYNESISNLHSAGSAKADFVGISSNLSVPSMFSLRLSLSRWLKLRLPAL